MTRQEFNTLIEMVWDGDGWSVDTFGSMLEEGLMEQLLSSEEGGELRSCVTSLVREQRVENVMGTVTLQTAPTAYVIEFDLDGEKVQAPMWFRELPLPIGGEFEFQISIDDDLIVEAVLVLVANRVMADPGAGPLPPGGPGMPGPAL